ncbi:MAG: tetratricopeptide repeat protein [Acidobacteria bacterium]|nr:tetratricopeptide repeat protein [Acidobacteriota bacterium]
MTDDARIADLRRRVQQDPASIAFAQLAEEYRRTGHHAEAVDTCRAGLAIHPEYLSARVTLGRALLALGRLDDAVVELRLALATAPENLAATRALAEAYFRKGQLADALTYYTNACRLAPNDPDLDRSVRDVRARLDELSVDAVAAERARARRTVAALERWLEAIHATRTRQHP